MLKQESIKSETMRPTELELLFRPITSFTGIGPKIAELIARAADRDGADDTRAIDLLLMAPTRIIDRRHRPGIAYALENEIVTLALHVDRHQPSPRGRGNVPYRVWGHDETGEIALTFFHARSAWLEKSLPVGERVLVSGRMEHFNGQPTMVHPDRIALESEADSFPMVEPVYPLTAGLSPKTLEKAISAALADLPQLPEWLETQLQKVNGFPSFASSLERMHAPRDQEDIDPQSPARRRLAYDELLAGQLSLALVRQRVRNLPGKPVRGNGALLKTLYQVLPFHLTAGQIESVNDILADLDSEERMVRLLQGDVGSGKTVVALIAMVACVEAAGQAVLMVPTEVLAQQHHASISKMLEGTGIHVSLLTGRTKAAQRNEILKQIESGEAQIIIGTHALFQESVSYHNLLLAVVDEQHRFGVHQRLRLTAKGTAPHMLVMTATPIPRTLVLAAFGDMDVSRLTEKPEGRKPITTATMALERIGEVIDRLHSAILQEKKIFWICPLVEESDQSDLISAEQRYEALRQSFGARVGLVHGRMKSGEKDAAMQAFRSGQTRILVATTVIEVGVDVPDASIIVIEHAERFGLAQLHQLRGRVGRGDDASSCILLYKPPLGQTARARLSIMRETEDGFRIAEEDLRLRGEGELLGTRQSGMPGFRIAALEHHGDLLETARNDARHIIHTDAKLSTDRGRALRMLLYIWRRDEAIRLLRAG